MIEIVHYINRWGKQESAVIRVQTEWEFTPSAKLYAQRYAAGELPPYYPVPAVLSHLNLIAAEPMVAWEDFKAIGHHGRAR